MKTTAFPVSCLQFHSWSGLTARVPDFIALMKPRVMVLAVFTAAAGVLNMWCDADIDAVMTRTAKRPMTRQE